MNIYKTIKENGPRNSSGKQSATLFGKGPQKSVLGTCVSSYFNFMNGCQENTTVPAFSLS